ncbi:MAG: ATP-grasp domain-containing protein [Candidatus Dojkabacteria bacterium]|nr:ATP-grasp domain-containing protein [Candidatus Dojkabacteria bacterium]
MKQIFYITSDPERACGVEDLLPGFHIIYSDNSQIAFSIANEGVNIKNFVTPYSNSTEKLISLSEVKEYIKLFDNRELNVIVFKNSGEIESSSQFYGYNLINVSYKLQKEIENKINIVWLFSDLNEIRFPRNEISERLEDLEYESIKYKLGNEFVIQFMFGHTGNSTFFIDSKEEFDLVKNKYPKRVVKISQRINGPSYTTNAVVTPYGIVVGGISEQITGIAGLTASRGGTVGNDFSCRHLDDKTKEEIINKTMIIGEKLSTLGFIGGFGVDFVIDKDTLEIFVIEVNARQTASMSYASYLQRKNKIVPIMLWHILTLLKHNFDEELILMKQDEQDWINHSIYQFIRSNDKLEYNYLNNPNINASQVIFRNLYNFDLQVIEQFPSGLYRIRGRTPNESALLEGDEEEYPAVFKLNENGWTNLCFVKRSHSILDIHNNEDFLIYFSGEKSVVSPFGEIGRIQMLAPAFENKESTYLKGFVYDVVNCIKENSRLVRYE